MAALNGMRTMLNRFGFTVAASQVIMDEQGLESLEEIKLLTDDEIKSLYRVIRRPGGMIPGPSNPGNVPVNNSSTLVILRAENHLKLLVLFLGHQERVNRRSDAANITLDTILAFRELRDFDKPPDDPPPINATDWTKTMESVHEYLRSYLGDCKIPLAYVVRKDDAIPVDNPVGQYATVQDAMIACARHFTIKADGTRTINPVYLTNPRRSTRSSQRSLATIPAGRTLN
jgi:hypothetical protein